jgi:hypothetical protein
MHLKEYRPGCGLRAGFTAPALFRALLEKLEKKLDKRGNNAGLDA